MAIKREQRKAIASADREIEETGSLLNAPAATTSPGHETKPASGSLSNLSTQKVKSFDHESGPKDWPDNVNLGLLVEESITKPLKRQILENKDNE